MNLRSARGFSLVELMIVVAIIGILAAIAIPNFQRFQAKSRQAEARANLSAIYAAEKAFNAEWQQFFGDFDEIGYNPEGAFRYAHGFATASEPSPASYTGSIGAGMAAVALSTFRAYGGAGCAANILPASVAASMCGVETMFAGGGVIAAGDLAGDAAATMFIATAGGNIDDDTTVDWWSINESKAIAGPSSMAAAPVVVGDGGDLDL